MTTAATTRGTEGVNACPITTAPSLPRDGAAQVATLQVLSRAAEDGQADRLSLGVIRKETITMAARRTTTATPTEQNVDVAANVPPGVFTEAPAETITEETEAPARVFPHVDPDADAATLATQARAALGVTDEMLSPEGLKAAALVQAEGQAQYASLCFTLTQEPFGLKQSEVATLTRNTEPNVSRLVRAGGLLARCGVAAQAVAREATACAWKHNSKSLAERFPASLVGDALVLAIVAEEEAIVVARSVERGTGKKTQAEKDLERDALEQQVAAERTPGKRLGRAIDALVAIESVDAEHVLAVRPLALSVLAEAVRVLGLVGVTAEEGLSFLAEREADAAALALKAAESEAFVSTMAADA